MSRILASFEPRVAGGGGMVVDLLWYRRVWGPVGLGGSCER